MSITIQPISEKLGQQIVNLDNSSILEIDKETIISLFNSYGVLLFRGFNVETGTFQEFTNLFSTDFLNYAGGVLNRKVVNGDPTLLTVNDFNTELKLHGEMYYQQNIPLMLWFFCANPPLEAGETTICDGRQFFNEIGRSTQELLSKKKLKFTVSMSQKEWQKQYKTDNFSILAKMCQNSGMNLKIFADKSILTEYICPATVSSRCGKYQVFINSLLPATHFKPEVIKFDDNSEIPDDVVIELNEIAERLTTEISWQKGDILMIDNTRILHGRRAFSDEKRAIYIRLCSPAF